MSGRGLLWWAVPVTALAGVAAMAALGTPKPATTTARPSADRLPPAARGPVSASLGRADAAYRVRAGRATNPAQSLSLRFSDAGVTLGIRGQTVGIGLSAFGRGDATRSVDPARPRVRANRVTYARGPIREWYVNGPLGLEQGFDVARPPACSGSRPITLLMSPSGSLAAHADPGGVVFGSGAGALRYGGLVATDAEGHTLRAWTEVAGGSVLIRVDDRGARYPLRIDPFIQQAKLHAADGAAGDQFGYSVAVSADTLVVGAPQQRLRNLPGAAYVFTKPASGWADATETAKLTASDGAAGDTFGRSVAVFEGTVAVGAAGHNVGANTGQGAVYVFAKPPSGWRDATQTAQLTASDGASASGLGVSVATDGLTIVAGAPFDRAVYVFERRPGGWVDASQTAELTTSAHGDLGTSVALANNTVFAADQAAAPERVDVFVMPVKGWKDLARPAAELVATNAAPIRNAIAASADTVAVGGFDDNSFGVAYVFERPAAGWTGTVAPSAELRASDAFLNDHFGDTVALNGEIIVVGAPGPSTPTVAGKAYVFERPASGWADATESASLTVPGLAIGDHLGRAVAASGDTALIGASEERDAPATSGQGAAYAFLISPSVTITSPADGATFTQGAIGNAAYACSTVTTALITSCTGPVANGAAVDTSGLGVHAFTVTAVDDLGATATKTSSYTVVAPAAPVLSSVGESHHEWREGNAVPHVSRAHKRPPVGTTFTFALDQDATVKLAFAHRVPGRRLHGACVRPKRANAHRPKCTRSAPAGTLTVAAHSGVNKLRFAGRISATKKLAPGRYVVTLAATNATGKRSVPRTLTFTVVK
jgi:hypothetical protein